MSNKLDQLKQVLESQKKMRDERNAVVKSRYRDIEQENLPDFPTGTVDDLTRSFDSRNRRKVLCHF
jgi:hypothetical protein